MGDQGLRRRGLSRDFDAVTFGLKLKRLRQQAGMTQEELSSAAGISRNQVVELERAATRRRPGLRTMRAISLGLGINLAEAEDMMQVAGWLERDESLPIRRQNTRERLASDPALDEEARGMLLGIYDKFTRNALRPKTERP